MVDPSNIRFPKVNKEFLKGLFWLLFFLFLASVFVSARGIYDIFIKRPEVRVAVLPIGELAIISNTTWSQHAVVVHNRGNESAKNLFVNIRVPKGEIVRTNILSDESYESVGAQLGISSAYTITRLAPGARFITVLWHSSPTPKVSTSDRRTIKPLVSVAFDGGVAESAQVPTALEEMQGIGQITSTGLLSIFERLDDRLNLSSTWINSVQSSLPQFGIEWSTNDEVPPHEFWGAIISIAIIAGLGWLLLPRAWAGLVTAGLVGVFLWLYLDSRIDTIWMFAPIVIGFIALAFSNSNVERLILVISIAVCGWITVTNYFTSDLQCVLQLQYNVNFIDFFSCTQYTVNMGIAVGFIVLHSYLVFVDFR